MEKWHSVWRNNDMYHNFGLCAYFATNMPDTCVAAAAVTAGAGGAIVAFSLLNVSN